MARKQKYMNELEKQGYSLVPETAGRVLDSIYHHDENQILIIRFATGRILTFKPIDKDLSDEFLSSE